VPLRTLSTRIAVPAGFFVLASFAAFSVLLIRTQREQALAEAIHGSENVAEIINLSLHHDMRVNRRDGVAELVRSVGEHLDVDVIRVFNKDGVIAYSSRPDEVGNSVSMKSEACVGCHAGPVPPRDLAPDDRSRIYEDSEGEQRLSTIRVINNEEGCQGSMCHASPEEQSVLGVLGVTVSLQPARQRVSAASRSALLVSLIAVALITGVLFFVIMRSVRRPLDTMIQALRRVTEGDADLPVPPGATREIGILAASFNDMVQSLNSSRAHLESWASSLEVKVRDTAAELRDAQFQVAHAERLSSVGLMAAGIAHELNSPLMAIITFTHLVRNSLPVESPQHEDLRMIEREANRCAAIIRQLLDFSRKQAQEPELEPCRVDAVVKEALALLKVEIQNSGVEISTSIPQDLPMVDANGPQLLQVFVNLVLNALQAMPDGGTISIESTVVERAVHVRDALPPHSGRYLVKTVVRDTGPGIPAESVGKVFDPFFTTKSVGRGSGLGLSVSLGLVRSFRGTILAQSDGCSGAEFVVLLPAVKEYEP
jgi:two-component system NtrC family sensor kinase